MKALSIVVITGPSGAGKRTAIKALEDSGYFCADNLPSPLLAEFTRLVAERAGLERVAVVMDVREGVFLEGTLAAIDALRGRGHAVTVLYLEASDEVLARRFSETRRSHPLAPGKSPLEGLAMERRLLGGLKSVADRVIDTSEMNVHQLRDVVREHCAGGPGRSTLVVNLVSFGFRYGVPPDADLLFDVRFLPNPFFVDGLRGLDGRDPRVREYVLEGPEARGFIERAGGLLAYLLPLYWREGKTYLTVAVGCTGGRHRSVVVAEELSGVLSTDVTTLRRKDRDIERT